MATVTDPAPAPPYGWFRISPRRIQAWRELNEMPDRELMRDGCWLAWMPWSPKRQDSAGDF